MIIAFIESSKHYLDHDLITCNLYFQCPFLRLIIIVQYRLDMKIVRGLFDVFKYDCNNLIAMMGILL